VAWRCLRAKSFRKAFEDLTAERQDAAKEKFAIFKQDPFDPSLGAHQIRKLSARYKQTVYGAHIQGNLIFTFIKTGNEEVTSLDIGDHRIYE
jgi:hypothetical protein